MSSCEIIQLPPAGCLDLYAHQLPEALRAILHTIIFHRSLGLIRPKEVDSELFDLTWVHCGDREVDAKVEEKVAEFTSWLEKSSGKKAVVCLSFYERKLKAAWFGSHEQRLHWERWVVNIRSLTQEPTSLDERDAQRRQVQAQLEDCILAIIKTVNERRDAIPPVTSSCVVTFPFDVTISGDGGPSFALDAVRRMLLTTNPPTVLH